MLFFAHWCPHCKRAYPNFSQAATSEEVKKYNFLFASINGDHYRNLLSKYHINGFPTIIYFSNYGREQSYYNGKTNSKNDFIEWIYRKVVSPLKEIKSYYEIKENYENKKEISYIYFGNIESELNIMKKKANKDFDHIYGHVKDEEVMKKYGVKPSTIVMFTSHDEKVHFSEGKIDDNTIKKLNTLHKYPYLMDQYDEDFFNIIKNQLYLLILKMMIEKNMINISLKLLKNIEKMNYIFHYLMEKNSLPMKNILLILIIISLKLLLLILNMMIFINGI